MVHPLIPSLTAVLLVSSACSLTLDGPAAQRTARTSPTCDTSKNLVGLDGVIGGSLAIASLASFSSEETGVGVVTGLLALGVVAAAVRGNTVVQACRAERVAYDEELIAERRASLEGSERAAGPQAQRRSSERANERAGATPVAAPADPYAEPAPVAAPASRGPVVTPTPRTTPPPPPAPTGDDEWAAFWTVMP